MRTIPYFIFSSARRTDGESSGATHTRGRRTVRYRGGVGGVGA